MLRLFVSVLPALAAVGAVLVVFLVPVGGSEAERFRKLLVAAVAAGVLLALISYALVGVSNEAARTASTAESVNNAKAQITEDYEQRITALNAQILDLQRRLAKGPENLGITSAAPSSSSSQGATGPQIYWTQEAVKEGDSGEQQVRFKIYEPLNIPAFVAVCDQPCRAERAHAGPDSEGTELTGSTSRNVAGYIFKKPRPMAAGAEGIVILRGAKGGFKVTEFRALGESEIPANLK